MAPAWFCWSGCLLQTKRKKGPATRDAYKEKLASRFRTCGSFEKYADDTARWVSLGPEAAAHGLIALELTHWDEVRTDTPADMLPSIMLPMLP